MPDYQPIPVYALRELAERYAKAQVVVVAWDDEHHCAHRQLRRQPLGQADEIAAYFELESNDASLTYEDFRLRAAAEAAAQIETLAKGCRAADQAFSSLLAVRTGLSDEHILSLQGYLRAAIEAASKPLTNPQTNGGDTCQRER